MARIEDPDASGRESSPPPVARRVLRPRGDAAQSRWAVDSLVYNELGFIGLYKMQDRERLRSIEQR